MEILITVCALFAASVALAFWMLRRSYDSQPKRPPTLTEEYLRNRALNDKHRAKAWPVDRDGRVRKPERKVVLRARTHA